MKTERTSNGSGQTVSIKSGMDLRIADFKPHETAEAQFQSTNPVLRFYFYIVASGYWELRSPYRRASEKTLVHRDHLSSILFYPELEGKMHLPAERRQFHLSISITPSVLEAYLGDALEQFPKDFRAISEGCENRGFCHSGPLSGMMNNAIQQILHPPYSGTMQRLYLESKAIELLTHKLAQISLPNAKKPARLEQHLDEIERVRFAGEILRQNLEYPPKLLNLAHTVGTNHSALNKGFREVFGTTVFGLLRQMRLIEAKRLLEEEGMNVTEAALAVGYSSIPSFSRAFWQFFGQPPSMCLKKKN